MANNKKKTIEKLNLIQKRDIHTEFLTRASESGTFFPPRDYKTYFPIIKFCRYCHCLYIVFSISFFGKDCICNCSKCGGRHKLKESEIDSYRKLFFISILIFALLLILLILSL